jgi:FHS family L-fucose permease-like MFS transporter
MKNYSKPLTLITILFFLFGFITCLNDILIPHLKALFTLNFTQAMLVQVCFFSAYFFMSIPSGQFTSTQGYRYGIVTGLSVAAIGTLGFIPAANMHSYPLFLISLFVLASGITLLQVSVNPYVTLLGDPAKSAFRLNLVQAFNSVGTTLAPLFGSLLILESSDKIQAIEKPYFMLTAALAVTAIIFSQLKLPDVEDFTKSDLLKDEIAQDQSLKSYFNALKKFPHLKLGMLAIFLYVGAEVSIGSFLVSWLSDQQVAGLSEDQAGKYVSMYWGSAMLGRFIGSYLTAKYRPQFILKLSLISAIILLLVATISYTPIVSMWAIIAIGLFNSVQFPIIFSLSVSGMGKSTAYASGLLCTCIVGGALIPLLQGITADSFSLRWSYIVPLICYLYIFSVTDRIQKA